jgi:hypothetical protein
MWEPRPLATLGASTACNKDIFTFLIRGIGCVDSVRRMFVQEPVLRNNVNFHVSYRLNKVHAMGICSSLFLGIQSWHCFSVNCSVMNLFRCRNLQPKRFLLFNDHVAVYKFTLHDASDGCLQMSTDGKTALFSKIKKYA